MTNLLARSSQVVATAILIDRLLVSALFASPVGRTIRSNLVSKRVGETGRSRFPRAARPNPIYPQQISKRFQVVVGVRDSDTASNTHVFPGRMLRLPQFICIIGVEDVKISGLVREVLSTGFCLCGVLFLSGMVEAEDHPAFRPVKELFAAMSKHDGQAMHETSTDDFQLLEHGEDWTMQQLVDAVQPKGQPYERKNFFCQIRAREKGDVAWISYWNKAEIYRDSEVRTIVWLESAVMVKEEGRWKIQLLHSTRLDPNKYPHNVQWIELEATP